MKRLFIIQQNDCSIEEAVSKVKELYPDEEYKIVFPSEDLRIDEKNSLFYFGRVLDELVCSDLVYFGKGWKSSTLAQLACHEAMKLGLKTIFE